MINALLCQIIVELLALLLDVLEDGSEHPDDGDHEGAECDGSQVEGGGVPHGGAQGAGGQVLALVQGPVPLTYLFYFFLHKAYTKTDSPVRRPQPKPSLHRQRRRKPPSRGRRGYQTPSRSSNRPPSCCKYF